LKLGIRLKLFLVSLALIAISFAAADTYLTRGVDRQLTANVQDDLFVRAALVAREAATLGVPLDDVDAWDALADRIGEAANARVTLIRRDGTVIGDSELDASAVRAVENHAARPEIMAALSVGRGASTRFSSTLQQRMMYVAVPFEQGGRVVGVTRVAEPLRVVDATIGNLHRLIAVASLLATLVAIIMSSFAAHWMSRAVRELTAAARRMTAGKLDVRTRMQTADELGELGRALDQLAGSLSATLDELTAERDLQRRILDGMQEGVLVLDAKGGIVMMNPALRAMLLLGADVAGKMLIEVVRHAELHELLQRARQARGHPDSSVDAGTTALGEIDLPGIKPRRLLAHVAALSGEAGGLLGVFVDVTDLRRLESLRRDFVANVSHELRTPVTAVLSAAETLKGGALVDPNPEVSRRFVDIIERNAQRLQSLIEDLLELSRLESTELRLKKERVELPVVASIVFGLFRERAERKRIALRTELPAAVPVLQTDQRALEQVLSNLVDNAVKYCPTGASITIAANADDGAVRISVVDDGPGIAPKHMPRLFERFYRVDAGRSREVGGTGLGLSIVKHLVEAMGGDVSVKSVVGKGSRFEVSFPREI
jgi:two-component system phosphate regulon sensor histidine kinase PhoR